MTEQKKRGFAALSPEQMAAIASKGGLAAHKKGTAHQWNHNTAKYAAQKSVEARAKKLLAATDDRSPDPATGTGA